MLPIYHFGFYPQAKVNPNFGIKPLKWHIISLIVDGVAATTLLAISTFALFYSSFACPLYVKLALFATGSLMIGIDSYLIVSEIRKQKKQIKSSIHTKCESLKHSDQSIQDKIIELEQNALIYAGILHDIQNVRLKLEWTLQSLKSSREQNDESTPSLQITENEKRLTASLSEILTFEDQIIECLKGNEISREQLEETRVKILNYQNKLSSLMP